LCTIFDRTLDFRASFPRRCDDSAVIALDVGDAALASSARAALEKMGHSVGGPESIEAAEIVVHGPTRDPAGAVASIRARGRIDVGVVVIASETDPVSAGAIASFRAPVDVRALVSAVHRAIHPPIEAETDETLDGRAPTVIGRLAASLSHELGTPLAALSMNLDVMSEDHQRLRRSEELLVQMLDGAPVDPDARAHLAEAPQDDVGDALSDARASVDRMGVLLARMKELAERSVRTLAPLEVAPIALQAARRAIDADVKLEESSTAKGRSLTHGPTLAAIVAELVRNASQAARTLSSPRVRVEVREEGGEVIVSVRDNGPGVPHDVREKIFHPFYTTKRGTGALGLGLTIARDRAEQLGGRIELQGEPGRGVCFSLRLRRIVER
jgi:signal transduction histidine kinase